MRRASRGGWLLLVLALASGCTAVRMSRLRPDYEQVDKTKTKRLLVLTQPLPDGNAKVGELWGLVARRYVNQKRNFLAKAHRAQAEVVPLRSACTEGIEGVLALTPSVQSKGKGVESSVKAQLVRCTDGEEIWAAEAGGSWSSEDPHLVELKRQYGSELGAEVEPYVPATFHLLKATLDTLPDPLLNDEDVGEKIELDE